MHINIHRVEQVIGYDPEMADMTNPRGAVYGIGYTVELHINDGEVYVYTGEVVNSRHADTLNMLFLYQINNGTLHVENHPEWRFVRYEYGSPAFIANYGDATIAMMDTEEIKFHTTNGTLPV